MLDGIQKGTVTIQRNEEGGITVEETKGLQKKENNNGSLVGQVTGSEVLDDEE